MSRYTVYFRYFLIEIETELCFYDFSFKRGWCEAFLKNQRFGQFLSKVKNSYFE